MRGAENIARELIRAAVGKTFTKYFANVNFQPVVQWFEGGGELKIPANASSTELLAQLKKISGLFEHLEALGVTFERRCGDSSQRGGVHSRGLWAQKRINRSEERGFFAEARKTPEPRDPKEPIGRMPRRQFN